MAPTFGEPITDIIKRRRSVRTYSGKPVPKEVRDQLMKYSREITGPFEAKVRFVMLDKAEVKAEENIKLGTYGMIQGATTYIAAAVERKERNMEQVGYIMEKLIMYATHLGLGTCWMAGTFNRSGFASAVKPGEDEIMPIVSPIGYAGKLRSPIDFILKPVPERKLRKVWDRLFFKDSFYTALDEADAGEYQVPLEMLRLAPSAANRQPWRVVKSDGAFHFFVAHDALSGSRHDFDVQKIDLGIAMAHFELAARELGLQGNWISKPQEAQEIKEIKGTPAGCEYLVTWAPIRS